MKLFKENKGSLVFVSAIFVFKLIVEKIIDKETTIAANFIGMNFSYFINVGIVVFLFWRIAKYIDKLEKRVEIVENKNKELEEKNKELEELNKKNNKEFAKLHQEIIDYDKISNQTATYLEKNHITPIKKFIGLNK